MRDVAPSPQVPPFGVACAIALAGGVVLAMQQTALPSLWLSIPICILGVIGWIASRRWRWLGALLFGAAWACIQGGYALSVRIPADLVGQQIAVVGHVDGLPEHDNRLLRFDFIVDREGNLPGVAGKHLRLSWYNPIVGVGAGERWKLQVKLRRPRGVLDPGGFDFEKLALERRIAATGYVRDPESAQKFGDTLSIDALRARLSSRIAAAVPSPSARFVRALALGDTRFLGESDWGTLRATGLTHQIAISGFHVGIVASFGALLAWLAYWIFPRIGLRWPRSQAQAVMALLFGLGYTAL
ncbi:MAG: ComEC/Rec2 family competence protein, partial [Lysobacteraceae bacterium]